MPTFVRKANEAEKPRAPALSPGLLKAHAEWESYRTERESVERGSVLRGSLLLAGFALLISLLRAGADRAFASGWWRQW